MSNLHPVFREIADSFTLSSPPPLKAGAADASPQQQMIAALEAILDEVSGFRKPFDGDSYLPLHLIAQAMDALEAAKGVQA